MGQEERCLQLRCVLLGAADTEWQRAGQGQLPAPVCQQLHFDQVKPPTRQQCFCCVPAGIFMLNNHSDWQIWRNSLPDNQLGGFM